jgi:hypothetical protein
MWESAPGFWLVRDGHHGEAAPLMAESHVNWQAFFCLEFTHRYASTPTKNTAIVSMACRKPRISHSLGDRTP